MNSMNDIINGASQDGSIDVSPLNSNNVANNNSVFPKPTIEEIMEHLDRNPEIEKQLKIPSVSTVPSITREQWIIYLLQFYPKFNGDVTYIPRDND
jgi:hypothetical protein